jgi:hypothetical protein
VQSAHESSGDLSLVRERTGNSWVWTIVGPTHASQLALSLQGGRSRLAHMPSSSQPDEDAPSSEVLTAETERFFQTCDECRSSCLEMASHGLNSGQGPIDDRVIHLLRKCATICRTSAASCAVGSPLFTQISLACAKLCDESATACERVPTDLQMQMCAAVCRACAESCRRMAIEDRPAQRESRIAV